MHNESIMKKNAWHVILTTALLVTAFVIFSPYANASITVDGDKEFTNAVNKCLDTYRGAAGIVGDVIKELEKSANDHKITNDPDWSNTVNDGADAFDGTGTGTVTRVDVDELEKYKKDFPELKNKDFCTALLHELWHAVDADRGEWTSDKIDEVKRNEVEATLFQNFVHAIRGVDPRTAYGGVDITKHVVIADDSVKESVKKSEPESPANPKPVEESKAVTSVGTSFKHVVPGKYSEVYATVTTGPGASVQATLSGPGVDSTPTQTITADAKGVATFTWRIVSIGGYTVSGTAGVDSFNSEVNVQ